jgi:hypothetical protein
MKQLLFATLLLTACAEKDPYCQMNDYFIGGAVVSPILDKTCEESNATPIRVTKEFLSLEDFPKRLTVNKGGARFRSSPEFNAGDGDNILGFIAENNELYASGPRKSEYGIYYIVPALDVNNQLCLSYVSSSVVKEKH